MASTHLILAVAISYHKRPGSILLYLNNTQLWDFLIKTRNKVAEISWAIEQELQKHKKSEIILIKEKLRKKILNNCSI